MMRILAVALLCLLVAGSASARRTDHLFPIQEEIDSDLGREKLSPVPLYFHGQAHPGVAQEISVVRTDQSTRGAFRSDRSSCRVAFLSALRELQARAQRKGADAIVGIRSVTRDQNHESPTEYRCIAGSTVVHVGLEGTLVKLDE